MLCLKFFFQYKQTKILTFILFHVLFYYFYFILLYVPSFKILSPESVEVHMSFVSNLPLVSVKLCISSSPVLLTVLTAGPRKKSTKSDRTLRHSNFVPSGSSISVSHWSPANDKIGFVAWGILAVCLKTKTYMFEFELKGGLTYWEKIYFIFQETHVKLLFLKTDNDSLERKKFADSELNHIENFVVKSSC